MNFNLANLDLGIIVFYLIAVILLGFYFGNKHKNAEDYFLAGRNLTWPIIGFSLFASNMSSNSLVGLAGAGYNGGFSVYSYEWMAVLVLIIFAVFFLPFYLKNKIFTIPEYLEKRFSYSVRAYASLIAIILNILVDIAATLYAGGLVINLIFPALDLQVIILGLAIIAGIYTITGGLSSVMYTDAVQAVILIMGSAVVTVMAFNQVGGWDAVMSEIGNPDHFKVMKPIDDPDMPWPSVFTGVLLIGFYFWGTNQYITQRTLASKNIRQGQWGAMFAGFLKLSILFIMIFPGAFARVIYPMKIVQEGAETKVMALNKLGELMPLDSIYPSLLFDLLPTGLLGVVLAGLIAAMMSSLDSGLNSVSTLITMDFVQKRKPDMDSKGLMNTGRIITGVVMVIAILWAPQIGKFEQLWTYLQQTLAWFSPPVVALFVMGLFFKRVNTTGALLSIAVGTLISVVLIADQMVHYDHENQMVLKDQLWIQSNFLYVATVHFLVCLVALFVGSMFGKTKPESELAQLVWTREELDRETEALKVTPWYKNYRYQAIALLIVVIIILFVY